MKIIIIKSIIILCCSSVLVSCDSNQTNSKKNETEEKKLSEDNNKKPLGLYIKTSTTIGNVSSCDSTQITSEYFEVRLGEVEGQGYRAEKVIEEAIPGKKFKYVFFIVIDKDGHIPYFKSSADFLNYMSERGYAMIDQIKNKYGADYTFKKK